MKQGTKCKSCRLGKLLKKEVSQTFEREGLEVKIEGVPALVCDQCGQIYYAPGVGDKIVKAADDLFALSEVKHAGQYRAAI
jgi:YgiT-type zinc finger domain-containing protein